MTTADFLKFVELVHENVHGKPIAPWQREMLERLRQPGARLVLLERPRVPLSKMLEKARALCARQEAEPK